MPIIDVFVGDSVTDAAGKHWRVSRVCEAASSAFYGGDVPPGTYDVVIDCVDPKTLAIKTFSRWDIRDVSPDDRHREWVEGA